MEGPNKKENPIKKALKKTAFYLGTAGILAGSAGKSTEAFSQTKQSKNKTSYLKEVTADGYETWANLEPGQGVPPTIYSKSSKRETQGSEPIFVTNQNDPRLKEYQAGLRSYRISQSELKYRLQSPDPNLIVKDLGDISASDADKEGFHMPEPEMDDKLIVRPPRYRKIEYKYKNSKNEITSGKYREYHYVALYPKPAKPVFLEGTKEAEAAKKQQELKNAGFKIDIDGDWGKKSQATWDEYQRSKVKDVTEEEKKSEVQPEKNGGVISNKYFPNPEVDTEKPDWFMMPDGKKYTYEELLRNYPMMKSDSVFKANFPGRERPKNQE